MSQGGVRPLGWSMHLILEHKTTLWVNDNQTFIFGWSIEHINNTHAIKLNSQRLAV